MKIALAQTNTTVGDLCGNAQRILSFSQRAAQSHADVVVFPELTLTGYPPRDLLEKQSFLDGVEQQLERIVFRQNKMLLPSYDVFDEKRYFEPAAKQSPLALDDSPIALTVCEDAWNDKQYWERRLYSRDTVEELAA